MMRIATQIKLINDINSDSDFNDHSGLLQLTASDFSEYVKEFRRKFWCFMTDGEMPNSDFIDWFPDNCKPLDAQFSTELSTSDVSHAMLSQLNECATFIASCSDFSRESFCQNLEGMWKYFVSYADSRENFNLSAINNMLQHP